MKAGETPKQFEERLAGYAEASKNVSRQHAAHAELGPLSDEDERILDEIHEKTQGQPEE